jgi:hypothetical protein
MWMILRAVISHLSYSQVQTSASVCLFVMLVALPGKDADKIRGEHPSILFIDEACFIENGGEAFDVARASRVPKILVVSSAAPSWFYRLTKNALPEPLS